MKIINPARPADAQRLLTVLKASTDKGCAGYYPDQILSDWHSGRTSAGMREFIIEEKVFTIADMKEIHGFLHLSKNEIVGLYVHPDVHGQGYGRALLKHAIKEIEERPIVVRATLNAVDFYAKFGFKKMQFDVNRRNERDIYVWIMELT